MAIQRRDVTKPFLPTMAAACYSIRVALRAGHANDHRAAGVSPLVLRRRGLESQPRRHVPKKARERTKLEQSSR